MKEKWNNFGIVFICFTFKTFKNMNLVEAEKKSS